MNTRLSVTVALMLAVCTADALARKWTDSTGHFSVEAELVQLQDGSVHLKKANGGIIAVALERLSEADQEFVKRQIEGPGGAAAATVRLTALTGKPRELAKDDGKPAGKKSLPRGHAVAFEAPEGSWYLTSVRIHGARYGLPAPPKEDFHVTLCDKDFKEIADFAFAYKMFQRGPSKWVKLRTKPTRVPKEFVLCAGFNAQRTKGVYVSHDGEGKSPVGLPGRMAGHFTGGDWMIRVELDQLKSDAAHSPRE